ncbi:hypothetical protein J6P92_10145, partial [bacterium]|nr:hypothetical protein [bacterium]
PEDLTRAAKHSDFNPTSEQLPSPVKFKLTPENIKEEFVRRSNGVIEDVKIQPSSKAGKYNITVRFKQPTGGLLKEWVFNDQSDFEAVYNNAMLHENHDLERIHNSKIRPKQ